MALARSGVEAYAAGDVEAALAMFHPDVVIEAPPGEQITTGIYHGTDGFLQWAGDWNDAWERFEIELERVEAVGERHAVAVVQQRGIGKGSGLVVEAPSGYVFEVNDEPRCVYFALYQDPDRAFAAARERETGSGDPD